MSRYLRFAVVVALGAVVAFVPACSKKSDKIKIGVVTNCTDPFWDLCEAGARKRPATFDAANADYQKHSATVAAIAAYNIANLPAKLDRSNIAPLEPRRMGVDLDKLQVTTVMKDGRAAAAGWQVGDEIVSIDGVVVKSRIDISQELQKGGPKKNVLIKRGDKEVQTVLDYSDDPAEPRRAAAAEKKAKKDAEKAADKAKKEADKAAEPKKDPSKPADKPQQQAKAPAMTLTSVKWGKY